MYGNEQSSLPSHPRELWRDPPGGYSILYVSELILLLGSLMRQHDALDESRRVVALGAVIVAVVQGR